MTRWLTPLTIVLGVSVLCAQQEPLQLQILVIGGEGSINNVKQRTAREPVVEVRDRNNRPVAGAVVLFEAPGSGPSGTFLGGAKTLRVTTDAQGRAAGQGFRPNTNQGAFSLKITATVGAARATTAIHMQTLGGAGVANVARAAGHGKLMEIVVGGGAAAAAGTAVAVTRNG